MGGPWEDYQPQTSAGSPPWLDYQGAAPNAELDAEIKSLREKFGQSANLPGPSGKPPDLAEIARQNIADRQQKTQFEASRTIPRRIQDTATFAASLPIRMATKGEYGLSDVMGVAKGILPGVDEKALADTQRSEADFVRANQTGNAGFNLENLQAAGDIGAGIPVLNTMGAVGGQALRSIGTGARALPGEISRVVSEESGMAKLPTKPGATGLSEMGSGIAQGISENLREMLWQRVQAGKIKEMPNFSKDSPILIAAKQIRDQGGINNRDEFDEFLKNYSNPPIGGAPQPANVASSAPGAKAQSTRQSVIPGSTFAEEFSPAIQDTPAERGPKLKPAMERAAERNQAIEAGKRIDVPVPRMVVGNNAERLMAGGLASIPYAGEPVVQAYQKGAQGLGEAMQRAVGELGTPGAQSAGTDVKSGILNWIKGESADQMKGIYDNLSSLMKKNEPGNIQNIRNLSKQLQVEKLASTSGTNNPVVNMVDEALKRPEGMTFEGLKRLRTDVGEIIDAAKITPQPGTSMPGMKRLYGAMTKDMEFLAKRAGGQKAVDAFRAANEEAAKISDKRDMLASVIGAKGDLPPEKLIERMAEMGRAKGGDLLKLELVRRSVGEQPWKNMAATLAERMGINPQDGSFSPARMLTEYGRYSPIAKKIIFGETRPYIEDIATVSERFAKLSGKFNTSNTGVVNAALKIIMNPISIASGMAGAVVSPTALVAGGSMLGGLRTGRSLAWVLSKPAVAKEASKTFKAYYNLEAAIKGGTAAIPVYEQNLEASIRGLSQAAAKESGGNAADIEKDISDRLQALRSE